MRQLHPLWFMTENCGYKQNAEGSAGAEILISLLLMPGLFKNSFMYLIMLILFSHQALCPLSVTLST